MGSVRAPVEDRSLHVMMIHEVKSLLGDKQDCSIAQISRCQNAISHKLATFSCVEARMVVWLKSGLLNVPQFCLEELPSV